MATMLLDDYIEQQKSGGAGEPSPPKTMLLDDYINLRRDNDFSFPGGIYKASDEQVKEWEGQGVINFFEQARRQDKTEMIPFNPESAIKSLELLLSIQRLQDGNTSDEQRAKDMNRFNTYLMKLEEERVRGFSIGGRFIQGVSVLPSYMAEFYITGGAATVGRIAVRKGIGKLIKKIVKNRTAKFAARTAGGIAGAAGRTVFMPHRTLGGTAERQINASLELTPKGVKLLDESTESIGVSLLKSWGDVMIENFSEVTGGELRKGALAVGRKIPVHPVIRNGMLKLFKKLRPNESVRKLLTKSGYNGFIEELGEERVGGFLRTITGVEDFGVIKEEGQSEASYILDKMMASIPRGEELLVEALVLAVPGSMGMATTQMVKMIQDRKAQNGVVEPELQPLDDEMADAIIRGDESAMTLGQVQKKAAEALEKGDTEEAARLDALVLQKAGRELSTEDLKELTPETAATVGRADFDAWALTKRRTPEEGLDVYESTLRRGEDASEAKNRVESDLNDLSATIESEDANHGPAAAEAIQQRVDDARARMQEIDRGAEVQRSIDLLRLAEETPDRPVEEIVANLSGQLEAAGFSTDVASAYAKIYESAFASLGKSTGLDPAELFERYGLTVQREEVQRGKEEAVPEAETRTLNQPPPPTTPAFVSFFEGSQVVFDDGSPRVVFHGLNRAERFGPTPLKSRSKSGPMPFFTDNAELASSYAKGKTDTSIPEEDQRYEAWFRMKFKGTRKSVNLDRAWFRLPREDQEKIASLAPRVTFDDDAGSQTLGEIDLKTGTGAYDQHIKESNGNHFKALIEEWLNSGNLFDREDEFMKVLRLAGVDTDIVEFHDPGATSPGVIPVYLSIKNPLDTTSIPSNVIEAITDATKGKRRPKQTSGVDFWDKNIRDPKEWAKELREAVAKGENSFVWTSIPDWVTKTLEDLGYDGIKDTSGKGGGEVNTVWIPFKANQIKSAIGNRGTFDPASRNILRQGERGSISFGPGGQFDISLLKNADLSTFLHETGHFYLEVMGDLSALPEADIALKDDYGKLLKWLGVKSREQITDKHHEKFARGFELYLREGKAPSKSLQSAFDRFRQWLVAVYSQVKELDVQLTDEVRGVLDRLIGEEADAAEPENEDDVSFNFGENVEQKIIDAVEGLPEEDRDPLQLELEKEMINEQLDFRKRVGKIRSFKGEFLSEELRSIPKFYFTKNPNAPTLDERAGDLGYESDFALRDAIVTFEGFRPQAKDRLAEIARILSELSKLDSQAKKDRERLVSRIGRLLARRLPASALKGIIRRATGQRTSDEITVPEWQALRESLRSQEKAAARAERLTRKEVAEVQKNLINIIKRSGMEAEDREKFIQTIDDIQTQAQLQNAIPQIEIRINSLIEKASKRQAINSIKKELKNTQAIKKGGRPVGKFTPEIQDALDRMRKASKLTLIEAEDRLEKNLTDNQSGEVKIPNAATALENRMLDAIVRRDELGSGELKSLLDTVRALKAGGREANKIKQVAEMIKTDEQRQIAKRIIDGRPKNRLMTTAEESADDTLFGVYNRLMSHLVGWDNLMNHLSIRDKTTGTNQSAINKMTDVFFAERAEKRGVRMAFKKVRLMYEKHYADDIIRDRSDLKKLRRELLPAPGPSAIRLTDWELSEAWAKDSEVQTLPGEFVTNKIDEATGEKIKVKIQLSRAQARKRWMEIQDPTTHKTIFGDKAMGWTQEMVDALESFLTEKDIAFARDELAFYLDYYNGFNAVYSDMNGVNLPRNPYYSPIRRKVLSKQSLEGEMLQEISDRRSITPSAGKSRVDNLRELKNLNDIEIIQQHIRQVEHYKAWARKIRQLNGIFNNGEIREAIGANFGEGFLTRIDHHIDKFTRGGIDRSKDSAHLNIIKNNFVVAVLGGKASVAVKQWMSFPALADGIPTGEFIKGLIDLGTDTQKKMRILASGEGMRSRGFNITPEMSEAVQSKEFLAFQLDPNMRKMFLTLARLGDRGGIFLGGWSVYRYHKVVLKKSHTDAMIAFERAFEASQQSASLSQISAFQGGSSWQRLFAVFMTSPNQYFRKELAATTDMLAGRIDKKQWLKVMIIYHVLLPAMFQWATDGLLGEGFRWKNLLRASLLGSVNGIFLLSQFADATLRTALNMKVWPNRTILGSIADEYQRLIRQISNFDFSAEDWFEVLKQGTEVGGIVKGFPGNQIVNIEEGLAQIFYADELEDYWKGMQRLAGWSKYIVEGGESSSKGPF